MLSILLTKATPYCSIVLYAYSFALHFVWIFSHPTPVRVQERLTTRADDNEDKVKERLKVFHSTYADIAAVFPESLPIVGAPFIEVSHGTCR